MNRAFLACLMLICAFSTQTLSKQSLDDEEPGNPGSRGANIIIQQQLSDSLNNLAIARKEDKQAIARIVFGDDFQEFWDQYTSCYPDEEVTGSDEIIFLLQLATGDDSDVDETERSDDVEDILEEWLDDFEFPETLCETPNIEEWVISLLFNQLYEVSADCLAIDRNLVDILETARNDYVLAADDHDDTTYVFLAAQSQVSQSEDEDSVDILSDYAEIALSIKDSYKLLCETLDAVRELFRELP